MSFYVIFDSEQLVFEMKHFVNDVLNRVMYLSLRNRAD